MEQLTFRTGRRPFGSSAPRLCSYHSTLQACRPIPGLGRRGVFRCAALSEGGSQGTSAALNPSLLGEATSQIEFPENPQTRAAPALKSGRVESGDHVQNPSESSWEEWLRHFDTMDELAEDAAHFQVELNSAIRQERYGDASKFKRKIQDIQAQDTVASVQRQLQDALSTEDYGAAAELRDRGLVGLAGWWAGKDGPEDFQGHLLHIKPEFGRWTGRIYMARDIAAMNGWREHRLLAKMDRSSSRSGGSDSGLGLGGGTIGTPMMEVFVRQQQPQAGNNASKGQSAVGLVSSSSGSSGYGGQQQQQPPLVPGLLVHQAVALRPPAAKAPEGRGGGPAGGKGAGSAAAAVAVGSAGGGGATQLNPASVVRLSIHVAKDGSARISVLPPKAVKSEFSGWEEEEMREAMAALAGDGLKRTPSSRDATSGSAKSASTPTSRASSSSLGTLDDFQRPSDDDDDDILTELTRMPAQVALQGRDRFTFSVIEEGVGAAAADGGSSASVSSAAPSVEGSSINVDLPRWAAVPIDEDEASGDEGESSPAAAAAAGSSTSVSSSGSEQPVVEVEVLLPDEAPGSGRRGLGVGFDSADEDDELEGLFDELVDDEDADDSALEVSLDMLSTGYGKVDAVATSVTDAEEQRILIEIPVGRLMRQQQRAAEAQREAETQRRASGANASSSSASSGPATGRAAKDTFDRLAERVAQLQASRAGRPVPPEHLATALRTLAERLVNGELAPDGTSSASATVPSAAALEAEKAAATARARLQAAASPLAARAGAASASSPSQPGSRRITYSRIPTNLPRSDPFCGLYLGAFGPHGPELIQLSRTMQDGEEVVCATKVTGDPNVPAGEVSFRAKVGRRHRLDSRDVYPEDLGIVARYKGEGRVAMAGYKSPRWVDGELLVFAVGSSPATGGAELGFVWSVPGEKRFLILLNKLDLKECEK